MTALQTTTATIHNGINSFISLRELEARLDEHIATAYSYCQITEEMRLDGDCRIISYVDYRDRSTSITACNEAIDQLSQCEHCDYYLDEQASTYTVNDETICCDCYNDNYFTCEECGETCHNDNYGSDGNCSDCERDHDATQYDHVSLDEHDPFIDFMITPAGRPDIATPSQYNYAIGLEIEAYSDHEQDEYEFQENERGFACVLSDAIHEIWTKENIPFVEDYSVCSYDNDGSLTNDRKRECRASFELEIMPLRVETCRKVWSNPDVLKAYSRLVERTTDKCGLHISIAAKHDLSVRVYARINILMRALQLSEEKARKILGRLPNAYSNNACPTIRGLKLNYRNGGVKTGPLALREPARTVYADADYKLCHCQERLQGRFEFRAFRAPMQNDLILRRIEYAVSMVEWSKAYIHGFYSMTYRELIDNFEQFHADRIATITK